MKSRILETLAHAKTNSESPNENLRVAIRVRPPMAREIKDGKFISTVSLSFSSGSSRPGPSVALHF